MGDWQFFIGVLGVLLTFLGFLWRITNTNNTKHDKMHQRITHEAQKSEERVKEVEEKLHADRVKVAEDYVSHNHLEKHVMRPMERGFEELKELIKSHH